MRRKALSTAAAALALGLVIGATDRPVAGQAQAPGKIEPELRSSLPPSGIEYFQGKTFWYWLKLGATPQATRGLTVQGSFRTPRFKDYDETVFLSQNQAAGGMEWSNLSFRFAYTEKLFESLTCSDKPANDPIPQSWTVSGTLSEDARTLKSLKLVQKTRYCWPDGGGVSVQQRDLELEFADLPLQKATGLLIGNIRGVLLDFGCSGSDLKKYLVKSTPAVSAGRLSFVFDVREEPRQGLTGRVLGRRPAGASPAVAAEGPSHPAEFPLAGVALSLWKDDKLLLSGTSGEDGTYFLKVSGPLTGLTLRAELRHAGKEPSPFRIVMDDGEDALAVESEEFTLPAGAGTVNRDVVLGPPGAVKPIDWPAGRLYDAALIYRYTQMAWRLIERDLAGAVPSLAFDPPLVVRAFATSRLAREQGAYGDMSKPELALSIARSESANELRAGTIWHELGHVVHGVMTDHVIPPAWQQPGYKGYHDGYVNPDTWASYVEGFATYFAALVGSRIGGVKPGVVDVNGFARNLSLPENMPWSLQGEVEEFAVASLLWDLTDEDENVSFQQTDQKALDALGLAFNPPFPGETPRRELRDRVKIDTGFFFKAMSEPSEVSPVPYGSPPMPVWDIRQLYAVLAARSPGGGPESQAPTKPGAAAALPPLDEVFVLHGFFADAAPQNLVFDEGEEPGFSANGGEMEYYWINSGQRESKKKIPARFNPKRRIPPPPPTLIACRLVDGAGQSALPRNFEVEVRFDPPYEAYSYSYRTRTALPGRLPLLCADPQIPSTTVIRALAGDDAVPVEVALTGADFWASVATSSGDVILSRDFAVERLPVSPAEAGPTAETPTAEPGREKGAAGPKTDDSAGAGAAGRGSGLIIALVAAVLAIIVATVVLVSRKGRKR